MDVNQEFILRGKGSDVSCDFGEPLIIPTDVYEARLGLKNFTTYNNIPNVETNVNNQIKVKVPGKKYQVFALETGAYELKIIYEQMREWIELKYPKLKNVEENFQIIGNEATSKAEFLFKDDYGVDFNVEHSMYSLLGFVKTDKFEGSGRYIAPGIVNIAKVTQLIFNCNITDSNYINGQEMPFLYNCGINVPVGYRLSRELTNISYKKLTTTQISHIRVWIIDQNGHSVNLREDEFVVTLSLHLKRIIAQVSIN